MIAIETLTEFFNDTQELYESGKAQFNINSNCRWSYFFIDTDKEKLTLVGHYLEDNGYEIIGFLEPTPEDEDQETIYLQADRVETHNVESLHNRNLELYKIAEQFGIIDYDGMDVGEINNL